MKIIFSIFSLLIFSINGCTDCSNQPSGPSGNNDSDYFIFGHFYGECGGERCVEIFKLQNDTLFEDILDKYPLLERMPYDGNFYIINSIYISEIKALRNNIPAELLKDTNQVFGTPDAHDQGGMILQVRIKGKVRYWLLDMETSRLPEYLREYAEAINNILNKIYS